MRTSNKLFPLFRSDLIGQLLGHLLVGGGEARLRELATTFEVTPGALTAPVRQLAEAGVITTRTEGRNKFIRADVTSPLYEPLRQLSLITYGPPVVIAQALSKVTGVTDAYIFGSWAARDAGISGSAPNDIDVLVLTDRDVERSQILSACVHASAIVRREVNPVIKPITHWKNPDAFVAALQEGPMRRLDLGAAQEGGSHEPEQDLAEQPGEGPDAHHGWAADFGLV